MLSTVVVIDTTLPCRVDDDQVGGAAGLLGAVGRRAPARRAACPRAGGRAGVVADQLGALGDVGRVAAGPSTGTGDEVGIADVAVAVGVHQPAGLGEQVPGHRVGRAARGDVGALAACPAPPAAPARRTAAAGTQTM